MHTGSGPIRYATVQMYLDAAKDVEEFCGVRYYHDGIHGRQCSCEAQKAGSVHSIPPPSVRGMSASARVSAS